MKDAGDPARTSARIRGSRNREYAFVSRFFVLLFVGLAAWIGYFIVFESFDFINSPYNGRMDSMADRVVRGRILSADGEVLARTDVYDGGYEERVYPYENVFAHVVGFDSQGKSGLESEANFRLLSSHAFFLYQMREEFAGKKNQGDDVVSTLDASLQQAAYYALGDNRGAVVAIEPKTGKIRAMVSKPDFDPNTIAWDWEYMVSDENDSRLLNRATNGAYPPGSIFKVVTALDYYRKKGTLEGFHFDCQGQITVGKDSIHCYQYAVHGEEDLYAAFANSCNCAFSQIGIELGAESLRETAQTLLFNHDLPLAAFRTSTFPLSGQASNALLMQTAIGQGDTLVSPAHMALITAAIANDGVLMKPYLIDEVLSSTGQRVKKYSPAEYVTLMSRREAEILQEMMEQVVTGGTGYALYGRGYTAAGKTGSAEYDEEGNSHAWFIGYLDVDDPKLAIAVVVEGGGAGSDSAVPVAAQIFDAYAD